MPARCHCDCCRRTVPDATDGYCPFCSAQCYPAGVIGGRRVRLAMSPASRRILHDQAAGITSVAPPDSKTFARRVAREAQRRVINVAVEVATPIAEQALRDVFKAVRRKLGG